VFLSETVTIGFLVSLCENKTTVQAHKAALPYYGKWFRFKGPIDDVATLRNITLVRLTHDDGLISVEIEDQPSLADVLHIGEVITVIGRIRMIGSTGLHLEKGEIEAR